MDLVCVGDKGDVLSIETAMKKDPWLLRGLFSGVVQSCAQTQPDTIETLLVEKAFRIAFEKFTGEKETHIKRYLLRRQLDKNTQGTPRAQLIASAMEIGGPQALIAVFYSTHDTHRNLKSRKTLRLLEEIMTNESKEHLFRRASQFPVNPSFNRWFEGLLEKLDVNALAIAFLLHCLRTSEIPRIIFDRSSQPARRWGMDGEIYLDTSKVPSVIRDSSSFWSAMQNLELIGLVRADSETVHVNQRLAGIFQDRPEIPTWRARAVQLLSHILPTHFKLEPESYIILHETLLPQLKCVLPYLQDPQVISFLGRVSGPGPREVIELCIASSFFSDHKWKEEVMALATNLLPTLNQLASQPSTALTYRLEIRHIRYAMLRNPGAIDSGDKYMEFPRDTALTNAWSANLILLQVYHFLKRNDFESAHYRLSLYSPVFGSTLEHIQGARIDATRGVVYRFQGRFREAYDILSKVESPNSEVLAHLSAVMCELGECNRVSAMTSHWLQLYSRPQPKAVIRVRLASINAELISGLQQIVSGSSWPLWRDVCSMYEGLQSHDQLSWVDRMTILIGVAITQHIGGDIGAADRAWNEVRFAYAKLGLTGYIQKIVDWSFCELELRQEGYPYESGRLEGLPDSTKREYLFTGLGTAWPAVLLRFIFNHGVSLE
ncbi:hypothetical protein GQX73_g1497 [Xylaria multiplex]|uniref:Uncharacterized protein n=1 Tax=Xylaria multiplex TaxID=323545 RepID=A0A7C8MZE0_9PEZI|nr:hypothetical protein GQX73_g1497 [Xylaria multiplex]